MYFGNKNCKTFKISANIILFSIKLFCHENKLSLIEISNNMKTNSGK